LDGDQHEILAEDNVATTEPRPDPLDFSSGGMLRAKLAAFATAMLRPEDLGREVEAMKRSYIITVCQAFRRRVEAFIEAKGGEIHK
ncbi:Putative transposable element, partial [Caligus rogercresseyi]